MREIRRQLPNVSVLYLGDTARLPYGTKSQSTVERYSEQVANRLLEEGCETLVIACNTASAMALQTLRGKCKQRVFGVIDPGARLAARVSRGAVGVIATESTVRSGAYERAICALRPELRVTSQACPLLVPLVEEGWSEDPITEQVARRYLEPLLAQGIDTLVLGCTHYPLLAPLIERVVGPEVTLVDSARTLAHELGLELGVGVDQDATEPAPLRLLFTDTSARFLELAQRIVGDGTPVTADWVDL